MVVIDSDGTEIEVRYCLGYEGRYAISKDGKIYSFQLNRWLKTPINFDRGYKQVGLRKDGSQKTLRVCVLLLEAWVGPRPPGLEALHEDEIKTNDNLGNLYWGTHQSNIQQAADSGSIDFAVGSRNGFSKLVESDIVEIRAAHSGGESQASIARRYEMHQTAIGHIVRRNTWTHVD